MLTSDVGLKNITVYRGIVTVILSLLLLLFFISLPGEMISEGITISRFLEPGDRSYYLDDCTITAYCPGECCNGEWAGLTSSGIPMTEYERKGIAIAAVDTRIIPFGSLITYEDRTYLAADVGSLIKGKTIDILVPDHGSTIVFGKRSGERVHVTIPR